MAATAADAAVTQQVQAPPATAAVRERKDKDDHTEELAMRPNMRYRVLRFIAAGSFGKIFQGVSMHSGEDVAVKFVRSPFPALFARVLTYCRKTQRQSMRNCCTNTRFIECLVVAVCLRFLFPNAC